MYPFSCSFSGHVLFTTTGKKSRFVLPPPPCAVAVDVRHQPLDAGAVAARYSYSIYHPLRCAAGSRLQFIVAGPPSLFSLNMLVLLM
jgi:hypothetical protein